jgi:TM2 domain-containing membrane protein YozV
MSGQGWGPPPNQGGTPQPGQTGEWGQPPNQPGGWGQPPNQPGGWGQPPNQPPNQPGGWGPPPGGPAVAPPGPGATKYCQACGSLIDARAVDCPRCGVRQWDVGYTEPKSRPIAIVLALILGDFGIHRFYLGPIAWGVVYLVFFWTGIPGIIAWFEAIYFLTRSDEEWARTYGGPVVRSNGCAIGCLWVLALFPLIVAVLTMVAFIGVIAVDRAVSL